MSYSCSNKFQQYHCYCYRCTGSNNLLVLHQHLWIQWYKKRDPFCCLNRCGKCYSSSGRPRYAMNRSYDKGSCS
ncbi:hypothetical protein Gotri_007158 [Gossypium trilobum]|uniref:Uncharacterized protein n=1 Tax=Gossypium trilobum TaxID=34281 RepID=A0A7J9EF66_9ROSI|nr:hypothetical protein [Gossypium trilobum]